MEEKNAINRTAVNEAAYALLLNEKYSKNDKEKLLISVWS